MAAMLGLVLLSAIAPLSSFSSSHQCHMACCAGKAPHAEGSCSVAFASEIEPNATDDGEEAVEEPSAHAHHGASAPAEESVSHDSHNVASRHSAHHSSSAHTESSQSLTAASPAMTAPCSPECAAAAVAPTHSRRPRDGAAMAFACSPRPPTLVLIRNVISDIVLPSSESRRQVRPRAPPPLLINPSA
ncbi:MAG: hypothetical protein QOJ64_4417 [Acidobacteriota bacterium]|nr:hypothetical protein [Acidobacteriota bacterium]